MSLSIRDIYLKEVRTLLFVRMLTLILQRLSKSIQTKEACPSVITVASSVTSDPNVHNSRLISRRFRGSCQQKLHQALYLRQHIRLHGISSNSRSLFLPIRVANERKPQKPNSNHGEGLLSLMQGMLRRMDNMDKTRKPPPRVKQVWDRNDDTIHPLRGSGLS
jgi:hypothetical protein